MLTSLHICVKLNIRVSKRSKNITKTLWAKKLLQWARKN